MKAWHLVSRIIAWQALVGLTASQLIGIPTVPYQQSGQKLSLKTITSIIVDTRHANARDANGSTLIPPTLHDFATTFAQDLHDTLGITAKVAIQDAPAPQSIFLTLGNPSHYLDAASRPTSEGYTLSTSSHGITVTGASPLGAWWATRTILQQGILKNGLVPLGSGVDSPGWATRGMMLDCGRHFYPKDFLVEMCGYMSFFKQNTFHVHLSDNVIVPITQSNFKDVYARFRLWSDSPSVKGLNNHQNESYTRADFDEIQRKCAARGVTILPEIEAPGHALPIVQWRPQVGYKGALDQLNISHPDTIPTMKTIWGEFLPWFYNKRVLIGADEYQGPEADYKVFVDEMARFIGSKGKETQIWGTFPPKNASVEIFRNVTIQHWAYAFGNPKRDYIGNGYSVINSDEMYYVVLKVGGYSRSVDISKTFSGNPGGGKWEPNIFSLTKKQDNVDRGEKLLRGGITPLWNDNGANTSVYSEAYYAWKKGIPALADKQWGGNLTMGEFDGVLAKFGGRIPGENLERRVASKGDVVMNYTDFRGPEVVDSSGNGYHGKTDCKASGGVLHMTRDCGLTTGLESKGRNYTLEMAIKVDRVSGDTVLVSGRDSVLMLTPNITLFAGGNYFRLNRTVGLGKWFDLKVVARGARTYASVDGEEDEFLAGVSNYGKGIVWAEIGIEAPIARVGGWEGGLKAWSLRE